MGIFSRKKPVQKISETTVTHPALGDITVVQSQRARRISVSVRPPGVVRLTLPPSVTLHEGMRFVESKLGWIAAARERANRRAAVVPIAPPYSTRYHSLDLRPTVDVHTIRVRIAAGRITVIYPAMLPYTAESVQAAIKRGIEQAWRTEAKELLPRRTAELARQHGFRYNSVAVRNTVSKWGSCSGRDDISLSLHLMRLPDELIDYIILHELCHTIHKNHSAAFHALLSRHTDGHHLELRRRLRSFSTRW
ncbi:MAG: M48 family metallopeptidase [Rikenellaceae bacterium]|nr:M48 family metallopeptidase [Rikenellaceae bacterium]MCL2692370.1 M48 family metallopeptidase [Rikenellaceae bacterium]